MESFYAEGAYVRLVCSGKDEFEKAVEDKLIEITKEDEGCQIQDIKFQLTELRDSLMYSALIIVGSKSKYR